MKVKLEPGAVAPKKAHDTDAAYDIYAYEDMAISPKDIGVIRTGVRMAIPNGYYGDVRPRSSFFCKGIDVSGVIDSGYRGEVMVMMHNHSGMYVHVHKGERIAQILFIKSETMDFEEVEELPTSDRGTGGFGSSGK